MTARASIYYLLIYQVDFTLAALSHQQGHLPSTGKARNFSGDIKPLDFMATKAMLSFKETRSIKLGRNGFCVIRDGCE
jgi:hypothetical protein